MPTGLPSSVVIASTSFVAEVTQISSAPRSSASVIGRSWCGMPCFCASSMVTSKVVPGSSRLLFGGEKMVPSFTISTLLDEASVSMPSRMRMVSTAPTSADFWRASTLPSRAVDLMSLLYQRSSRAVIAAAPSVCHSTGALRIGLLIMNTVGFASFGNAWSRGATPRVTWMYKPWSGSGERSIISLHSASQRSIECGFCSPILSMLRCMRCRCSIIRNGFFE